MSRAIALTLACAVALGVAAGAAADRGRAPGANRATAAFHDLRKAVAAGYTLALPDAHGTTCIFEPGEGGMGIHMVNEALLDGTIDPEAPEVLVYEPWGIRGKLKLVAVEYVVFEDAWHGAGPPRLFGHEFDYSPSPNRYGLPGFYALHAWIWKPNPSGLFAPWNPRVRCPN